MMVGSAASSSTLLRLVGALLVLVLISLEIEVLGLDKLPTVVSRVMLRSG